MRNVHNKGDDRRVELLQAYLAELTDLGGLVERRSVATGADASPLSVFLNESDRIVASLVERRALLERDLGLPANPAGGTEAEVVQGLWHDIDLLMRRLRTGLRQFTQLLSVGDLCLATGLEELAVDEGLGDHYPERASSVAIVDAWA